MPNVVMDSLCHQAIRHLGTEANHYPNATNAGNWQGLRLSDFIDDLSNNRYSFSFVDLENDVLQDFDVLIIASRSNLLPFSKAELNNISSFYGQGGSILLMANHRGFVAPQNQVCSTLGLPFTFNEHSISEGRQTLVLNTSHSISENCLDGLCIRTSCTMSIVDVTQLDILVNNQDQRVGIFASAITNQDQQSGRVVSITSSGHIASRDDASRNLYNEASNSTWTINSINWLADNT